MTSYPKNCEPSAGGWGVAKPPRTFGGTSGIRVRVEPCDSYAERFHPVVVKGLLAVDIPVNVSNARNLHKQLGKALAYLDQQGK